MALTGVRITIALVLSAIPTMAFGQTTVACEACTHDLSFYLGDGGLVAEADGADMVTWVATCGGVTHHGELEPNREGVVMLQFMDSGLVCNEEESRLQIGPVKDGGWYWLTRDTNSAVGSLVNQDILDNAKGGITNAGSGVTMTIGRGAVLLEEAATGRLGLLPNILPEPQTPALRKCGYDRKGTTYTRRIAACALGDGGAIILATVTDGITGTTVQIPDGGTVTRAAGTGTVEVLVDLWANGSGHYTTDPAGNARLGHPEFGTTALRGTLRLQGVSYPISTRTGSQAAALPSGGVTATTVASAATVTIAADSAYCSAANNFPLHVDVSARLDPEGAAKDQVTPSLTLTGGEAGLAGKMTFTVICP